MKAKLTRRQQEFLNRFLDLYHEIDGPIHYGAVAERLQIGRVTAYEMLRLLESRGLVKSSYHLPAGKRGPGRAMVLFSPSPAAGLLFQRLAGRTVDGEHWEVTKEQILEQLRHGKVTGYETLLAELLARVPGQRNLLVYMGEMTAALLLSLRTTLKGSRGLQLRSRLKRIGLPGEIGLSALAGMGMAFGVMEQVNRRIAAFLFSESSRYQRIISDLTEENRRRLGAFAREIIQIIQE